MTGLERQNIYYFNYTIGCAVCQIIVINPALVLWQNGVSSRSFLYTPYAAIPSAAENRISPMGENRCFSHLCHSRLTAQSVAPMAS